MVVGSYERKILDAMLGGKTKQYTCSRGHSWISTIDYENQQYIDQMCVKCTFERYEKK